MKWTFDIKPSDVFWCTADVGWVTGHTYVCYGPLATGTTEIVFEGVPTHPGLGRSWRMCQDHKVSVSYTAPTAIRSLIKANEAAPTTHPTKYDLRSLRILGTVGEPINPEAWMWYYRNVGASRCPIVDTFWQTETGGHMISPLPGATPLVPGSCTLPLPGIEAAIVDEAGHVGRPDEMTGEAVCAFVVLKQARPTDEQAPAIAKQLRDWVAKEIGPIAKPKDIRFGDNLPKTRSGKIMRRLLRSIAKGEEIKQDVSTLENPAILDQLKIAQ